MEDDWGSNALGTHSILELGEGKHSQMKIAPGDGKIVLRRAEEIAKINSSVQKFKGWTTGIAAKSQCKEWSQTEGFEPILESGSESFELGRAARVVKLSRARPKTQCSASSTEDSVSK